MMEKEHEYNTSLTKLRHVNYVRNHRAVVALWAVFVVIALILNVLVFLQPQWIGDDADSIIPGYFGTWEYCYGLAPDSPYTCEGDFLVWDSILNGAFQATSLMVVISCLCLVVSIICFVLFCLLNTATVLKVCACFQGPAALLMLLACVVYPIDWDNKQVRDVCGPDAGEYSLGVCQVRWGYVLAITLVLDTVVLTVLALVLAGTTASSLSKPQGKVNEAYKD